MDSIIKNFDQIYQTTVCFNRKFILHSETKTNGEIEDGEIKIENYKCVCCDSNSRHTGRVLLYMYKCRFGLQL